ncbi:mechanosensitive ion channel [Ruminococcaceae bacterium OttesenSCG-928-I18]|nr:mechanosensitive ion channel [Ruminococcaceae bacterium OttesenSCG-928-I18]
MVKSTPFFEDSGLETLQSFLNYNRHFFPTLLTSLLLIAAFGLVGYLLGIKLMPLIQKRIDEKKHPILSLLLNGFQKPLFAYLLLVGVGIGVLHMSNWDVVNVPWFVFSAFKHAPNIVYRSLRIVTIICVAWGFLASSDIAGHLLSRARSRWDLHMSKGVMRFLSGMFKIIVVAIATVMLLSELNYNINGLIAGLGLGGLTIALAAKDSAANFFGGLVLILDKPFDIGDWIVCGETEGTVEDINMRSTIIRNDSGSLTTVPNSLMSSEAITNFSGAMNQRRADIILNLEYGVNHKQMREFTASVRNLLETDPEVVSDSVLVRFSEFGQSSLDVRVIFYTALPGFSDHLRIRERINYAIMDLAEKDGISFAFPTRTVELQEKNTFRQEP